MNTSKYIILDKIIYKPSDYKHHKHNYLLAILATYLNFECQIEMFILNNTCLKIFRALTFIITRPILRIYQSLLGTYNFKLLLTHIVKHHTI